MSRRLSPVEAASRPRRLESRAEIERWVAERRQALSESLEGEWLNFLARGNEQLSFDDRRAA